MYDTGVIVRHYPAGLKEIEIKVELTAHHKGYFEFKLCANNEGPITQECLNRYSDSFHVLVQVRVYTLLDAIIFNRANPS